MKCKNKYNENLLINKRIYFIGIIIIIIFIYLIYSFFDVMIINNKYYKDKLKTMTNKIIEISSAPRGRIYDRNYNLLVDNKLVRTIIYKKDKTNSIAKEINLAKHLSEIIQIDYNKINEYSLKEYYMIINKEETDNLITKEEYKKVEERILNLDDIKSLKMSRISKEKVNQLSEKDKKTAFIYYLMNKGYSYLPKTIKNENITNEEIAYITENKDKLLGIEISDTWERVYLYEDTFKSILGTVSSEGQGLPKEDIKSYLNSGYSLTDRIGISYIEKQYENVLKGEKAKYIVESNTKIKQVSEAKRGNDIVLTIDINLQKEIDKIITEELIKAKNEPNTELFNKTFAIIQEPNTGEILAMSGKELIRINNEYQVKDYSTAILTNPMTPGSVIKGASMLVGYNNNAIKFGEILKDNCIKILGTKQKCSYNKKLGYINDIKALAYSSNSYQFQVAMKVAGHDYKYNAPLYMKNDAFSIYRNTFKEFGLGVKTEIDLPVESSGVIGKKTDSGLLLDLSMGQYDSYTTMQLSQYITTIASNGNRYKPHLLKEIYQKNNSNELGSLLEKHQNIILNKVTTSEENLNRVKQGLIAVMDYGLGKNVMGKSPKPAGKTGTSETFIDTDNNGVVDTYTVSNAFVGYAPHDNPKMTITVTSPDVEKPSSINFHSYVNRRIARKISDLYFKMYP